MKIGVLILTCSFLALGVLVFTEMRNRNLSATISEQQQPAVHDRTATEDASWKVGRRATRMHAMHPDTNYEFWAALIAMNYVQAQVSTTEYSIGLVEGTDPGRFSGSDAYLSNGVGICGAHATTLRAILEQMGIKVRYVQFFEIEGTENNHIAVEVFWDDSWHYFDATWGLFVKSGDKPDDVMSVEQFRQTEEVRELLVLNQAYPWTYQSGFNRDRLAFLDKPARIVYRK